MPRKKISDVLCRAGLPSASEWIALHRLVIAHRVLRAGHTIARAADATDVADAPTLSGMMFQQLGVRPPATRSWSFEDLVKRWWDRKSPRADCNHVCKQCTHLHSHVPSCPPEALWVGLCSTCEHGGQHAAARARKNAQPPRRRATVAMKLGADQTQPGGGHVG